MFKFSNEQIQGLSKKGLSHKDFFAQCPFNIEECLEVLLAQGVEVYVKRGKYFFKSCETMIHEENYCIVDIEANGSDTKKHQIIEIGAVKIKDGKIVDTYESLVYCEDISRHIVELTGITPEMTKDAPYLNKVMQEFRLFLGTDVFIAHAVKFDYNYISDMFEKCNLLPLQNRFLCSIGLAERSFISYKYGLKYLNDNLKLYETAEHHRALSDAMTTAKLFQYTLKHVDKEIRTSEELIRFSKEARRLKRPMFDPNIVQENEEIEAK